MSKSETTSINMKGYEYPTVVVPGKDGKKHYVRGSDDAVSRALTLHRIVNGKTLDQVVRENKLQMDRDPDDYANTGQFVMAVSNRLRALVRGGTPVKIGAVVVEKLTQSVELPSAEADAPKARAKSGRKVTKKAA